MKKLSLVLSCGCAMALMGALVGCGTAEKPADEPQKVEQAQTQEQQASKDKVAEESVSLDQWKGTWNNLALLIDEPRFDADFEKAAKEHGKGESVEDVRKALKERRQCEFSGLKIDGNKVSFYEGKAPTEGGTEESSAEYEWKWTKEVKMGSHTLKWNCFEAKDSHAKYPVLLFMPIGDEGLKHFHLRYGSNADELLAKDSWFPAMVDPNATQKQLDEEFSE